MDADLWFLVLLTVILILTSTLHGLQSRKTQRAKSQKKSQTEGKLLIPSVSGSLPLFGHGLHIFIDTIGFVSKCYEKYGSIFKIKIFRKTFIMVCDREHVKHLFKAPEDQLSSYELLSDLYFPDAFSDSKFSIILASNVIKQTVGTNFHVFIPKIEQEAQRMILNLREKVKQNQKAKIDLIYETMRFVASTSMNCFVGIPLTDDVYKSLHDFTVSFGNVMIASFIFPKWMIRLFIRFSLSKHRKAITKFLEPEIEKYIQNPNKSDSMMLRAVADLVHEETGEKFSNQDVGDFIVLLLFVSSSNSALGVTNLLIDLASNMENWIRCRKDVQFHLVENKDVKGLLESEFLNACTMETARLNSHIIGLARKPQKGCTTFGDYYLDEDVDGISVCAPIRQVFNGAEEFFSNPRSYNPSRFLRSEGRESLGPKSITTWGAGHHLCPGRIFSIMEIKIATALFLLNFEIDPKETRISEKQYFSAFAFAERKVQACLQIM